MKAITCSQCGALIKRISLTDKFAHCDYCGAKILIEENKEQIIEIREKDSTKPPTKAVPKFDAVERDQLFRTMVELNNDETVYDDTRHTFKILAGLGIIAFFIVAPVVLVAFFASKADQKSTKKVEFVSTPAFPTPKIPDQRQEPLPDIKYRSYVQYDTNIDADLLELPVIRLEQLPTTDLKELRKTVFAQRKIRVRITIDENGDVNEAKALNGHEVLRESSVEAAKKSLFSARKRKTTTVLTYIYILE